MKRTAFLLSLFLQMLIVQAQIPTSNEFVLTGEIKDATARTIYLAYTNKNGSRVRDSCRLQRGRFTFRGNINGPGFGILKTNTEIIADAENKNIATLFLEPGNLHAKIVYNHFADMRLTGSKTHDEYMLLDNKHRFINKTFSDSLYERHSRLSEEFIFDNTNSYISAYELSNYRGRWPANSVRYLFSRLSDKIRNSVYGKEVSAFLDDLDANSEGSMANDFVTKDLQEKILKLSDFKGKYVLLDFWGSWCVPCRESTPHLIELFKKYSDKGLTVIGVATEYEKTDAKWREAIQKDGTGIWFNVLSIQMPGSTDQFTKDIAGKFAVHVFPTKILIDPCGYIIGRFRGTDEDDKLDEQLKKIYN